MNAFPGTVVGSIRLILGWLAVGLWGYVNMLLVELYWNLVDWEPRADWKSLLLLLCVLANLVASFVLARATRNPAARTVSLFFCVVLVGIGFYVLPAEPLGHGLFARTSPSPLWYRGTRLIIMALPSLFWAFWLLRRRRGARRPACSA